MRGGLCRKGDGKVVVFTVASNIPLVSLVVFLLWATATVVACECTLFSILVVTTNKSISQYL